MTSWKRALVVVVVVVVGLGVLGIQRWLGSELALGPLDGRGSAGSGTLGGQEMGRSLKVGDKAPDFRLQDGSGHWVQGAELWADGPAVIFFYPRDETTICTAEACSFQSSLPDFSKLGTTVVGISADTVSSHEGFARNHGLTYPLLSDSQNAVRRAFGVPKTLGIMPGRSTYVIDGQGIIRHVFHAQLSSTEHVDEALGAIGRLKQE